MDSQKIISLVKDIEEIDNVINNNIFDRTKAEGIIRKHNLSNLEVAILNSPLNSGYTKFENATDNMIVNNLLQIKSILYAKLQKEILEDKK